MAEHATKAKITHGTQFQRGNSDGPPETFTNINEVTSIDPPTEEADDIEVTHFESPGKRKEYIRGLIDTGEASFTLNWNPLDWAIHDTLRDDLDSGTARNWRFVLNGGIETVTFPGYIKSLKRNMGSASEAITADVVIKVTGASTVV